MTRELKVGDRVEFGPPGIGARARIIAIDPRAPLQYSLRVEGCRDLAYWSPADELILRPFELGDAVKLADGRRGVIRARQTMTPSWDSMRYTVDVGDGGRVYATIDELEADLQADAAKPEEVPRFVELPVGSEIRRVELRPGDALVITTPKHINESEVDYIGRWIREFGERRGIAGLEAMILEDGLELRGVLGPERANTEEAAK